MENNNCWCPVCQMSFETHRVTEEWVKDRNLFLPPRAGGWLNLAAHLAYEPPQPPLIPRRKQEVYRGEYFDTPPCSTGLWEFEDDGRRTGTITCWCGDNLGGTDMIGRFAEHLWISNDKTDGGLDQHYRQAVATTLLGAM